jgi:hypothetical protein
VLYQLSYAGAMAEKAKSRHRRRSDDAQSILNLAGLVSIFAPQVRRPGKTAIQLRRTA